MYLTVLQMNVKIYISVGIGLGSIGAYKEFGMHKQMTVSKNIRVLFATALFLLAAAVFAVLSIFGFNAVAYADEGDPIEPEVPPVTIDEVGNRIFAGNTTEEFTIADSWVYGTDINVSTPRAKYYATGAEFTEMNITLHLNGDLIDENIQPYNLPNYVNKYMPAGDYNLVLASPAVTKDNVFYDAITYDFEFTVERAEMPQKYINEVKAALTTGLVNEQVFNGEPVFYSSDITFDFIEKGVSEYDRGGDTAVYWSSADADKYFGGFELLFNVNGMDPTHYHTLDYYRQYFLDHENGDYNFDCDPILPCDPGAYTVYYMLSSDNYLPSVDITATDERVGYYFDVTVFGEVDLPSVPNAIYTGEVQKGYIYDSLYYTVEAYNGWADAGTHTITLELRDPSCYLWKGQTIDKRSPKISVPFTIMKANNDWAVLPDVVRWVEGKYNPEENLIVGTALFGSVEFEITDADDNVVYSSVDGINKLADLKAGIYNFSARVAGDDNYNVLSYSKFIRVLEKQGLPWWGTLCIALGALLVAALIILILYKKGVFRLLTDKIVLSIRTKATIDATIAAVRANKVAEQSRASRAEAEARDRAAEQAAARKQAAAEARNLSPEEKAAALEAKAQATADKAEAMRQKAEAMQARVDDMRSKSAKQDADRSAPEATETTAADAKTKIENKED